MISLDEAFAAVEVIALPLPAERVPLIEAFDRVLAVPLLARTDAPARPLSAMDGYAVREADLGRLPVDLPVQQVIFAGHADPAPLAAGACARIFTGAPVPEGADRIIVQEQVEALEGGARFSETPGKARHIRACGSDFHANEILLDAGALLTPQAMVAAAAADFATLQVVRRPKVFVLGTGDELAEPGLPGERPGMIPETVSFGVMAMAARWGAEPVGRRRVEDDSSALETAAAEALKIADVVVVTGGASVGERDHARAMFASAGLELIFSKVAIKPGKPVWMGRAGGRLVVGLPGNPTSAMVTARLFLAPLLAGLVGRGAGTALSWRSLTLAEGLPTPGERETLLRGKRMSGGDVAPLGNQESGAQRALAGSDLLIRRPAGAPPALAGETVSCLDF
ncbi:molybdopterin molybdotransferase MoeA [Pseudanabaena biceps]|jgi:molybdopterin molybdotransferase|nr:molybdopterin molybdotransferase MoeA [Pseudanabaena biceps]